MTWGLFVSELGGGTWSELRPLPAPVNSDRHDMQLWEARDGELYFASARDGNVDIYRATCERDGNWRVSNAGVAVNSPSQERFPFVSSDGRLLLFASDRPGGSGKDDVYVCHRQPDGTWGPARNAGTGINSADEEWYPRLSENRKYLFFTSARSGNHDVYWMDARSVEALRPDRGTEGLLSADALDQTAKAPAPGRRE